VNLATWLLILFVALVAVGLGLVAWLERGDDDDE
jgi:hypothetical protein